MWWLLLGAAAVVLVKKIVDDWGWEKNCNPRDIHELPNRPGIYVLYRGNRILHVGSSRHLRTRLATHPKRHRISSFDWFQTASLREAKHLEKELHKKLRYPGK